MLEHETLDAYQCAVEFLAIASRVEQEIPRGYGDLRSQLRKASTSIPLNIAEGVGKTTDKDERKFFDIARGSANECGAVFDSLHQLDGLTREDYRNGKELLERIVSMLSKLRNPSSA
jgi:four helix bundle protein